MPAGRPTKYNEDMLDKALDYLENFMLKGDAVPSHAGLACELRVNKSTIYAWAKEHPDFSNTLEAIKERQERMLVNGGLTNEFNGTITKLMLANYGYSDKLDQSISSPDGSLAPTKIELVGVRAE